MTGNVRDVTPFIVDVYVKKSLTIAMTFTFVTILIKYLDLV